MYFMGRHDEYNSGGVTPWPCSDSDGWLRFWWYAAGEPLGVNSKGETGHIRGQVYGDERDCNYVQARACADAILAGTIKIPLYFPKSAQMRKYGITNDYWPIDGVSGGAPALQ